MKTQMSEMHIVISDNKKFRCLRGNIVGVFNYYGISSKVCKNKNSTKAI